MMFSQNNIILSSVIFGSVYIFSNSLIELNKRWMKYSMRDFTLFEVINLTIMGVAGAVLLISYTSIEIC